MTKKTRVVKPRKVPFRKKFDKFNYTYLYHVETKKRANEVAKKYRVDGYFIRILPSKIYGKTMYKLYVRAKGYS